MSPVMERRKIWRGFRITEPGKREGAAFVDGKNRRKKKGKGKRTLTCGSRMSAAQCGCARAGLSRPRLGLGPEELEAARARGEEKRMGRGLAGRAQLREKNGPVRKILFFFFSNFSIHFSTTQYKTPNAAA
jgi:hypothetical protein